MKQLVKVNLPIEFIGIDDWDAIATVDFAFAQRKSGEILKRATYPTDVSRNGDVINIPWTREETKLFKENASFWLDVRPTTVGGYDLEVEPIQLEMHWTLFKE